MCGRDGVLVDPCAWPVRLSPRWVTWTRSASRPVPPALRLGATGASFGATVWAPHGTRPLEEEPDEQYTAGDALPGGLLAVHTPGPEDTHFSFLLEREGGVLFYRVDSRRLDDRGFFGTPGASGSRTSARPARRTALYPPTTW